MDHLHRGHEVVAGGIGGVGHDAAMDLEDVPRGDASGPPDVNEYHVHRVTHRVSFTGHDHPADDAIGDRLGAVLSTGNKTLHRQHELTIPHLMEGAAHRG